jgi:hypothetical protein
MAAASAGLASPGGPAAGFSIISDLRRQTSELLHDGLNDERAHQLWVEGESTDSDQAVIYGLDAIRRARQSTRD